MKENIQMMRKMRAEGYSLKEIANHFGLSISTVYEYVKDVSYNKRARSGRGQRIGDDERQAIIAMYKNGKKISEIARALGIHYQTVYKYVKMVGENGELDS